MRGNPDASAATSALDAFDEAHRGRDASYEAVSEDEYAGLCAHYDDATPGGALRVYADPDGWRVADRVCDDSARQAVERHCAARDEYDEAPIRVCKLGASDSPPAADVLDDAFDDEVAVAVERGDARRRSRRSSRAPAARTFETVRLGSEDRVGLLLLKLCGAFPEMMDGGKKCCACVLLRRRRGARNLGTTQAEECRGESNIVTARRRRLDAALTLRQSGVARATRSTRVLWMSRRGYRRGDDERCSTPRMSRRRPTRASAARRSARPRRAAGTSLGAACRRRRARRRVGSGGTTQGAFPLASHHPFHLRRGAPSASKPASSPTFGRFPDAAADSRMGVHVGWRGFSRSRVGTI